MNFSYTVSNNDIAKSAIDLIKSFWAPGVGPRKGEYFDKRYTDSEFDAEDGSDSIFDYVEMWEANEWPDKIKFMNTMAMVCVCYDSQPHSSPLFAGLKNILMRIYKDVFNEFKDTYYKAKRYDCLTWIYDNKMIQKLMLLYAVEEGFMIPIQLSPYKSPDQIVENVEYQGNEVEDEHEDIENDEE